LRRNAKEGGRAAGLKSQLENNLRCLAEGDYEKKGVRREEI